MRSRPPACTETSTSCPRPVSCRARSASSVPTHACAPVSPYACSTDTRSGARSGSPQSDISPPAASPTRSFPAHPAFGPASPNGVMTVRTTCGAPLATSSRSSGHDSPRSSGETTTASALAHRSSRNAASSADASSSVMLRLPACICAHQALRCPSSPPISGTRCLVVSPLGGSTRRTSAPSPASMRVQTAPISRVRSMMRYGASAPVTATARLPDPFPSRPCDGRWRVSAPA